MFSKWRRTRRVEKMRKICKIATDHMNHCGLSGNQTCLSHSTYAVLMYSLKNTTFLFDITK